MFQLLSAHFVLLTDFRCWTSGVRLLDHLDGYPRSRIEVMQGVFRLQRGDCNDE